MTDRILNMQKRAMHTKGIIDKAHHFLDPEKEIAIFSDSLLAIEPDSKEFISDYGETEYEFTISPANSLWHLGGNHGSCDYRTFIYKGIHHYQTLIAQSGDSEYLTSLSSCCEKILCFVDRYRVLAEEQAKTERNPLRKEQLNTLSTILKKVPRYGAQSFYEAVQSYWIAFYIFRDGMGRLDSYLTPYYEQDLKQGVIREDEALELIEELLIKIFSVLGCNNQRSADNHMVLGGKPHGMTAVTRLILKAIEELDIYRPQATFRWYQDMPYEDLKEAVRVHLKKYDHLMFINDELMIKGFEKLGAETSDAQEYSLSGCNEAILTGMSHMGSVEGFFNLLVPFFTVYRCNFNSYQEFYNTLLTELKSKILEIMNLSYQLDQERSSLESSLESLTIQNCISTQKSFRSGGAKYNFCNWCLIGFCELVDSLSIIKDFVFEQKIISLDLLRQATDHDFNGYEEILNLIRLKGRFLGNDDDFVDQIAVDLAHHFNEFSNLQTPFRGGKYTFGTLAGIENMHIVFGNIMPATPDGRKSGESLSASLSVTKSKDKNGPTALLRSLSKIDFTDLPVSVVTNITLSSDLLNGADNLDRITHLILGYFKMGGVQLQLNYLSKSQLLLAQRHPEDYENLRVRVTGYSGYFTKMSKELQDEIINRTVVEM